MRWFGLHHQGEIGAWERRIMATKGDNKKKAKGTDGGAVVVCHNTTTSAKNQGERATRSPPPRRRRRRRDDDDNEEHQQQEKETLSSSSLHNKETDGSTTTTPRTSTRRSSPRTATTRSTTTARSMAPVASSSLPHSRPRRRRTERGPDAALQSLAECIVLEQANIVIISGAGLSVPSGVRPFRNGPEAIWHDVIWTTATRAAFRKNPPAWYQNFWHVYFDDDVNNNGHNTSSKKYRPNNGHLALDRLLEQYGNVRQVTQNIDGLQQQPQSLSSPRDDHPPKDADNGDDNDTSASRRLIEAHGRLGLYKCCPDFDSSDDDDDDDESSLDDDDDDNDKNNNNKVRRRPVHLGHRKKARRAQLTRGLRCPYQYDQTISASQLHSTENPKCPYCGNPAMPQALLFDEGYHSHSYYQFTRIEDWLANADVLVFVGTSFAVRLTQVALDVARQRQLRVYNINTADMLSPTLSLQEVSNIVGCADALLPRLLSLCDHLRQEQQERQQPDQQQRQQREGTARASASKAATS
jgi:NAD-dependent deacetylase